MRLLVCGAQMMKLKIIAILSFGLILLAKQLYAQDLHIVEQKTLAYDFKSIEQLPACNGLPDPFVKPNGKRVQTLGDWIEQRDYLKSLLSFYQYGHAPKRPYVRDLVIEQLDSVQRANDTILDERYAISWTHNAQKMTFHMSIYRNVSEGHISHNLAVINNVDVLLPFKWDENNKTARHYDRHEQRFKQISKIVAHGYTLCEFKRNDFFSVDAASKRDTGVFDMYQDYDWSAIAVWAWGQSLSLDVLIELGLTEPGKALSSGEALGGKVAVCAGIYDERFGSVAVINAGIGATESPRLCDQRQWAIEMPETRWHPNFKKMLGHKDKLAFDVHMHQMLIAPRAFISIQKHVERKHPLGTELMTRVAHPLYVAYGAPHNQALISSCGRNLTKRKWDKILAFNDQYFFGKEADTNFYNLHHSEQALPIAWDYPQLLSPEF